MLREILFHELPVLKLLNGRQVIFEDGALRRLHGKVNHEGGRRVRRLPHFGVIGDALILQHLEERVSMRDAHAADVVRRVARMHAGGAIHGLRQIARRLRARDAG